LIEIFKLLTGRLNLNPESFFQLARNEHGLQGHSLKLFQRNVRQPVDSRLLVRRTSLFGTDCLKTCVGHFGEQFQNRLDKHCNEKM